MLFRSNAWYLNGNTLNDNNVLGSLNSKPLKFITNNVERMRIAEDGPVGIGTSSPFAMLDVVGNHAHAAIQAKNTNADGPGVMGIGQNASLSNFPLFKSGGAFLGAQWGVYGQVSNTSGERAGGLFRTGSSAYARVGGYDLGGTARLIWGFGTIKSSFISPTDGSVADMSVPFNPEMVITDYGIGKLVNGRCSIKIDPVVSKRIHVSDEYPIKVFIQLEGDCNGVYVTNKSATGFDVVELKGGVSSVPFSWTLTANLDDIVAKDGTIISKHLGTRAKEYVSPEIQIDEKGLK